MAADSNLANAVTRRFLVSGRVQGVWFRASTKQQAEQVNVCGYAKNLQNGSVEVLLQGMTADVQAVAHWLLQGPRLARVDKLQEVNAEMDYQYSDFSCL